MLGELFKNVESSNLQGPYQMIMPPSADYSMTGLNTKGKNYDTDKNY